MDTENIKPEENENLFAQEAAKQEETSAEVPEKPEHPSVTKSKERIAAVEKEMEENGEKDSEFDRGEEVKTKGFSNKAKGQNEFEKIGVDEEFPEDGMWLDFENIYPGKVYKNDEPLTSQYGKYYERKLVIEFSNVLNDRKLKELMSKVTYGLVNGEIQEPRIKAACDEEDLDDQFTQDISKFRYLFLQAFPDTDEKQSDADFIEALLSSQCKWKKVVKKWKKPGQKDYIRYAKLVPMEFRSLEVVKTTEEANIEPVTEPVTEPVAE